MTDPTPSHQWHYQGTGMLSFRYGNTAYRCAQCGGSLLKGVQAANAVQVCQHCGAEQTDEPKPGKNFHG